MRLVANPGFRRPRAEVAPDATIGVEGSASYGAPAARFLLAAGRSVREVPPQLSRRERIRTRRAGKSDPGDALAIARVTAREPDLPPIRTADQSSDIAQLVEAREDVVAEATRVRNRLHADLRVLVPGYGEQAANPVAACHQRTVARLLCGLVGVQAELARERLAHLRVLATKERRLACPHLRLTWSSLHTACSQAGHDVALEDERDDHGRGRGEHRAGGQATENDDIPTGE